MNNIAPQYSLPFHPDTFEYTSRAYVFNVTHSVDTINVFEICRPVNTGLRTLGYIASIPVVAAKHISEVRHMVTNSASDHSDNSILPRLGDCP